MAVCGWCQEPLPDDGTGRQYCGHTHKTKARKRRGGKPNGGGRRLRAGCTKTKYSAKQAARMVELRGSTGSAYQCPAGSHWHVTSEPSTPRAARRLAEAAGR